MDINSLLSPQETPPSAPATGSTASTAASLPAQQSPHKIVHQARAGSIKQAHGSSPFSNPNLPASSLPQHIMSPLRSAAGSSPAVSPTTGVYSVAPTRAELSSSRSSSTQHMDTLADLASMQNHQPQRSAAPVLVSRASYESQLSPSTIFPTVQSIAATSNPRSSFDIAMVEAPKNTTRTSFAGTTLPKEAQEKAALIAEHLQKNPYAYDYHIELIKILHEGFKEHVYPRDSPETHGDPHTYDLLSDLRLARENMDKLFAIGEDLWLDWLQDESLLARTIEERIGVMENCAKATREEYGSTKLWVWYGQWVAHCHDSVQDGQQQGLGGLSQDDILMGREAFTRQLVQDVWKEGVDAITWRVNDSHLLWDQYIDLIMEDMQRLNAPELVSAVKSLFEDRLRIPHANWDGTFQKFSTFVSTYFNNKYEDIMASANRAAADAKAKWGARELFEIRIQKAQESKDRDVEYNSFAQYVEWERQQAQKSGSNFEQINALYERAALRFPSDHNLWEEHAMFIVDESFHAGANVSPLPMLERATRHCPWSGWLWSQYLLSSERAGVPFTETEGIKHKATNTGLLDVGGKDEVLKVHVAWCSYLRRRAFSAESTDEDIDVAAMGIRSSIEILQEMANKGANPDPEFRLERIYIKYLSQSGSWDSAREAFRGLIPKQGNSWEFWMRFYIWEMLCWSKFILSQKSASDGPARKLPSPQYATGVLREALHKPNLDWPEKIMETLIAHCQDHEDVEELQQAVVEVKRMEKIVQQRRFKEAAEASATAEAQVQQLREEQVGRAEVVANGLHIGKRKREDDPEMNGEISKKTKAEESESSILEPHVLVEKENKRDRENATVLVRNLPEDVTETRLRQFFRNCGIINSLKLQRTKDTSAVIEFNEKEEALFAQSRDGKDLDGATIKVQLGSGSILFITNFPPTADEASMRELFEKYGEIAEIRFPSLQFNTHRRFCYVEFVLNQQAQSALDLNGHAFDDGLRLSVKLSDPEQKQNRSGAMEERREVYVKNVNWSATENDLKDLFSKFGNVESTRIPRNVGGSSKGFGYVVFSSPEEANAALALHDTDYRSRTLHVELSSKGAGKRKATTIVNRVGRSATPSMEANGAAGSPSAVSMTSTDDTREAVANRHARTFALMDVPDTVNDSRIRSLAENHGSLVKVTLLPQHQGAILEYVDENDAGKAQLELQGFEIAPGRKLRIGGVNEMRKEKAEYKTSKTQVGKANPESGGQATIENFQSLAPIRRPGQQGPRRGGLGQKRGFGFHGSGPEKKDTQKTNGDIRIIGGKSNDDFKAMIEKK